jgi:hypothetical protein
MPRSLVFSLLHSFWRDGIIEPPFAVREHRTRVITVFLWSHYNRPHGTWRFKTPMDASNFRLALMRKISVINNCIGEVQTRHIFFVVHRDPPSSLLHSLVLQRSPYLPWLSPCMVPDLESLHACILSAWHMLSSSSAMRAHSSHISPTSMCVELTTLARPKRDVKFIK